MTNLDEQQVEWLVEAHDPARKAILYLTRCGYHDIVLPRALLRGMLSAAEVEPPVPPSSLGGSLRHYTRLFDCVKELQREH